MNGGFSAPLAILLVFQLAFNFLFILTRVVIPPLTDGAAQNY